VIKLVKCYIWSTASYGAETWTLWKVDEKYLGSFKIWCWRRKEKMNWTYHVRNKGVLRGIKEERRKANWTGHVLHRNYP